jgi:esterase/lipase superfamily enzyme
MKNSLLYWKLNIIFSTRRQNRCSDERVLDADGLVTHTVPSALFWEIHEQPITRRTKELNIVLCVGDNTTKILV